MIAFCFTPASWDWWASSTWSSAAKSSKTASPPPEMDLLVAQQLRVRPRECLAIEDSPAGAKVALAAGTEVIAVTTRLIRQKFRDTKLLNHGHVWTIFARCQ
jgi:beta-phosphoglucomutase-like phosphatase (HAD superfamily)